MDFCDITSGFDVSSDAYLHDVIINEMKDKTVLLITHRYENLENIDIVYKIEDGGIVKQDEEARISLQSENFSQISL